MRVLFIGGTGNISSACTNEALRKGFEVFHLNRGNRPEKERREVKVLRADIRQPEAVKRAIGSLCFDSVVQFLGFEPKHIEADIQLFKDITHQYIFISSCSAYKKHSSST